MSGNISELDAILIATAATHEQGTAVIQALKAILSFNDRGEPFPPALAEWLRACVKKAELADQSLKNTATRQRAFSKAFGYTQSRGNPHGYGERNFQMVSDIWRIHKSQGISLSKAINAYVLDNPSWIGDSASTAYIEDLIKKYRSEVSAIYEEWIGLMDQNQTAH